MLPLTEWNCSNCDFSYYEDDVWKCKLKDRIPYFRYEEEIVNPEVDYCHLYEPRKSPLVKNFKVQ